MGNAGNAALTSASSLARSTAFFGNFSMLAIDQCSYWNLPLTSKPMCEETGQQPSDLTTPRVAPRNGGLILNPDSWRKIRRTAANILAACLQKSDESLPKMRQCPTAIGRYTRADLLPRPRNFGVKPAARWGRGASAGESQALLASDFVVTTS